MGRRGDYDLVLDAEEASRRYARFALRASRWWVVDLASTHGVLRNDEATTERAQLPCGDRVTVGDTVFALQCDNAPAFDDRHRFERSTVDGLTGLSPRWPFGVLLEAEARRAVAEHATLAHGIRTRVELAG